jgi:3-hydroxyacyl-[acyl-carrier-protein] dehydratase
LTKYSPKLWDMKNYLLDQGFYKILETQKIDEDSYSCTKVIFNKDHSIFKSHFPGFPVTPGICICQIAQELIQGIINRSIRLISGKNIKFIEIINPEKTNTVKFEVKYTMLEDGNISTQVVVRNEEMVFSKLSLSFVIAYE